MPDETCLQDDLDALQTEIDDLRGLVEALNRARTYHQDRIDDLEAENEQLREQLAELKTVVDPNPGSIDYSELTRDRKVQRIRQRLVEEAAQSNGKARLQYKEVQWLFDGHPSPAHCYDLMELSGTLDGFAYDEPTGGGQKRIRVNLEAVNDEALIHAAKKARERKEA